MQLLVLTDIMASEQSTPESFTINYNLPTNIHIQLQPIHNQLQYTPQSITIYPTINYNTLQAFTTNCHPLTMSHKHHSQSITIHSQSITTYPKSIHNQLQSIHNQLQIGRAHV